MSLPESGSAVSSERRARVRDVRATDSGAAAGAGGEAVSGWRGRSLTYRQQVWETIWVTLALSVLIAAIGYLMSE